MGDEKIIRLLIVDDEVPFLNAISERLRLKDFDVTSAENGEMAMEAALEKTFDVAVVDRPDVAPAGVVGVAARDPLVVVDAVAGQGHGAAGAAAAVAVRGTYAGGDVLRGDCAGLYWFNSAGRAGK